MSLTTVLARIEAACLAAHRVQQSVRLLAVTKGRSIADIQAWAALGQRVFGENYLQEALPKLRALQVVGLSDLEWHFIGRIQANKTRQIAEHFDWVDSVCDASIVRRLNAQRSPKLPPLQVCLQVNIDDDPNKAGLKPDAVFALADQVVSSAQLKLRGLMVLPQRSAIFADNQLTAEAVSRTFLEARQLFEQLKARYDGVDTLSMGMSQDFEAAIFAGSTIVRVGSAL